MEAKFLELKIARQKERMGQPAATDPNDATRQIKEQMRATIELERRLRGVRCFAASSFKIA